MILMFNGCNQASLVNEPAAKETCRSGLSFFVIPTLKSAGQFEGDETGETVNPFWGEEVNGLRAAVEFFPLKESHSGKERMSVRFHIQNVSDHNIQIAS